MPSARSHNKGTRVGLLRHSLRAGEVFAGQGRGEVNRACEVGFLPARSCRGFAPPDGPHPPAPSPALRAKGSAWTRPSPRDAVARERGGRGEGQQAAANCPSHLFAPLKFTTSLDRRFALPPGYGTISLARLRRQGEPVASHWPMIQSVSDDPADPPSSRGHSPVTCLRPMLHLAGWPLRYASPRVAGDTPDLSTGDKGDLRWTIA